MRAGSHSGEGVLRGGGGRTCWWGVFMVEGVYSEEKTALNVVIFLGRCINGGEGVHLDVLLEFYGIYVFMMLDLG